MDEMFFVVVYSYKHFLSTKRLCLTPLSAWTNKDVEGFVSVLLLKWQTWNTYFSFTIKAKQCKLLIMPIINAQEKMNTQGRERTQLRSLAKRAGYLLRH